MASDGTGARIAVPADVPELIRLRGLMIEALGVDTSDPTWATGASRVILDEMASGRLVAAVVDSPDGRPGTLVASGIVQFAAHLPNPRTLSTTRAYISSMYTESAWRRRGLATLVLTTLLDECRQRHAVVELHAAPEAHALYVRHGFTPRAGNLEMRWRPQNANPTALP